MAKKFLDLVGLQKYDELLKGKVATDIKAVQDDLDTRKVKDTSDSATITWSKGTDGTYTASVAGDVVVDSTYQTVKTNANNSAAAWTKFLQGAGEVYPNGITPVLIDLATKTYADDAADDAEKNAKSYADSLASNYDAAGSAASAAATAEKNAKDYADSLASNYDAVGSAAAAESAAKSYADGLAKNYDAAGSAAAAESAAIGASKQYTDGEIKKVDDKISSINTAIAGGVHFIGISSSEITDGGTQTPTIEGWTGPANKGDIVINTAGEEFIWDGAAWQKLGDTTAEQERLTDLETNVSTLMGDESKAGSVAKALKDAKDYTDSSIDTLIGTNGQVGKNTAAIAILNGNDATAGSVAKALKDAKDYADQSEADANDYTDTAIDNLVGADGQVGKNTAAITKLNGDDKTEGSVDYKIAQAVATIEDNIDAIETSDIEALF